VTLASLFYLQLSNGRRSLLYRIAQTPKNTTGPAVVQKVAPAIPVTFAFRSRYRAHPMTVLGGILSSIGAIRPNVFFAAHSSI
jgi:hypothetical protein